MPINNMNPEGLVKEIKIKNKNQAYKRRWKEPLFLDNNKPQVSLENGLFLMPKYSTEETLNEKDDLESQIQNLVQGENDRFLLILGEPGGGKSTLVAYILNIYEDTKGRKPIVYPCAAMQQVRWSPTNYNLFEDIMRELRVPEYKMLSNHVLILDGFDEVEVDGSREDLLRHLYICWENAAEDYGLKNFSLIITSRRNYLGESSYIEVPYIILSRFDKDQIIEFCNKYFERNGGKTVSKHTIEKMQEMETVFGIPILLYMTIALEIDVGEDESESDVYDKIFTLDARERGIYDRCRDQMGHPLTVKIKGQIHEVSKRMAYWMFEHRPEQLMIDWESYRKILDEVGVNSSAMLGQYIHQIHHTEGNTEGNGLVFIHKTIYEYFLARAIVDTVKNQFTDPIYPFKKEMTEQLTKLLNIREIPMQTLIYLERMIEKCVGSMRCEKKQECEEYWINYFESLLENGMQYPLQEKSCCNLKVIDKEITAFLNYLAVVKIILLKISGKCPVRLVRGEKAMELLSGYIKRSGERMEDLSNLKLPYISLRRANLNYVDFSYSNLKGADFFYASLNYTNFTRADVSYCNMHGADCIHARMDYADLSYSDLRELNLYGAQMEGTNLRESSLAGANLEGTDVKEAL